MSDCFYQADKRWQPVNDRDLVVPSSADDQTAQVRVSKTWRTWGVYACPLLSDRNPIRLRVPSENGLLLEPPQRHKDITTRGRNRFALLSFEHHRPLHHVGAVRRLLGS